MRSSSQYHPCSGVCRCVRVVTDNDLITTRFFANFLPATSQGVLRQTLMKLSHFRNWFSIHHGDTIANTECSGMCLGVNLKGLCCSISVTGNLRERHESADSHRCHASAQAGPVKLSSSPLLS